MSSDPDSNLPEKITHPETVADAKKAWLFGLGSLAVAWGAHFILAGWQVLPVIVAAVVMFAPPILALLGLVQTIENWKNHKTINGIFPHALLGMIVFPIAVASMIHLFIT